MAIQESGVRLSVQNLGGFINDINRANSAYDSFGSGGAKSLNLGGAAAGLGQSIDKELGTVQARFGTLNSFMAGIFAGAGAALGSALISGITTAASAIPNLIGKAFSEAIDLQQQAADAFAITQPSQQEQAQLAQIAEQVALNPNLQVSQQGALEAIGAALTANISAQQIMSGGVIEAIVAQQNALGGSFNDNARLIAKQLNDQVGQAEQLSAQQLANQNVGTFKAGQFQSINDLLLAQAAAGGALKNLGVSQQQFNEFLAIAGTTASGGSDAGTSVKAFINAATNASKTQAAAQDALNFNIADSTGQFNDALALSQQLSSARIEGLNAIIETGGGTKEQQAELKRLNKAINSNLNSASNLASGITGVNLTDEQRAKKIATANAQAQAAKKQFDEMLGTVPALQQTATKIKASETAFAGTLFAAFGTDGGRFAAALAGLSAEEIKNVEATIAGADALEVAAIKTDTVKAKLEAIGDIFSANITKIAKPTLAPLKDALSSFAVLLGKVSPVFDLAGKGILSIVSGPLALLTRGMDSASVKFETLGTLVENFTSGFSQSIALSDIIDIQPGGLDFGISKDMLTGGSKIFVTFGDIFSFESGEGGTKLNLKDYFTLDTTGEKVKINVKDYIEFVSGDGTTVFTIKDFFTFASNAEKTIINIKDFIEFSTDEAKTTFNVGDYITFSDSIIGTKFKVDLGKYLDVSGGITPSGVFTLSLNGSNFRIDTAAVISNLQNAFTQVRAAFDGLKAGYDVAGVEGALLVAGALVRNAFSKLSAAVQSISIPDIASSIKQKLQEQFTAFNISIPDIASSIKQRLSAQFTAFNISLPDIASSIKQRLQEQFTAFNIFLPDIASSIKQRLQTQFTAFNISLPDIASSIKQRLSAQFTAFNISLPDIAGAVKEKLEGMFSTGQNAFGNATGLNLDFSGFTTAINDFKTSLGGLAGFVPGLAKFAGVLTVISAVKTEGLAGIGKNISSVASGLGLLSYPISTLAALPYVGTAIGIASVMGAISVLNTIDTSKFETLGATVSTALTGVLDFGTKLVEGFDAESFAGTANDFVTGFVDRISATISGVDTGAIATSALGFATSILNKLSTVFSDPNLGSDIGASAAGLVGSLVSSLSGVFSDPKAFANLGEGATNLTLSLGSFVTSLVTSFGTELSKVDFGELVANGALSLAGFTTGITDALTSSIVDGLDEVFGTKLVAPKDKFNAFIDAIIEAVNKLDAIGIITTQAEADAENAKRESVGVTTKAESGVGFGGGLTIADAAKISQSTMAEQLDAANLSVEEMIQQQATASTAATEATKTWSQTIQDAAIGFAGTFADVALNSLVSLPLPVTAGAGNGLNTVGASFVRLDASKVEVQGPTTKAQSGEPTVTFDPAAAVNAVIAAATAGRPVQGPVTQAQFLSQTATPTGGGSSLFGASQQAAQPQPTQTAATPTGGGTGFLGASLTAANAQVTAGASSFANAMKSAAASVKTSVKIPPFKWPVIPPFNLGTKVPIFQWPKVSPIDLSNFIPPFPGWASVLPFINVPAIPPFPGWQAFVKVVTVQQPTGSTGGGGNTGGGGTTPDPGPPGGEVTPAGVVGASDTTNNGDIPSFWATYLANSIDSLNATIVKLTNVMMDQIDDTKRSGGKTVVNRNTNILSVTQDNGSAALLKSLLSNSTVEKRAALLNATNSTSDSTPSFTDKNAILALFGNNNFNLDNPFGGRSSGFGETNKNQSQTVNALIQSPPSVTNNYYNNKHYNLNIYTYQSEAALSEQFAYMEHLGAAM